MGDPFLLQRPAESGNSLPSSETPPLNNYILKWNYQANVMPRNTPSAPPIVVTRPPIASDTELVFCPTISDSNIRATANYGNVKGGYVTAHQSAHWYGGLPLGANILFMDGHVSWRNFKQMQARLYVAGASSTQQIVWWW